MKYSLIGESLLSPDNKFVIIVPGLLGYAEEEHLIALSEDFKSVGIPSIRFTPESMVPDKDGFLNKYTQEAIYRELESLIDTLVQKYTVKVSELVLVGLSAGGPIIFKYASKHNVAAVIGIVTPYQVGKGDDLKLMTQWEEQGYLSFRSSLLGEIKVPYNYFIVANDFNSLDYCADVKCPKLLVAGELDTNVPKESPKKLFDACDEPKEFVVVEGMVHKYKKNPEVVSVVNSLVLNFVEGLGEN